MKRNKNKRRGYRPGGLLYLLGLLILTSTSTATIRYVSPTGNNIPPYLSWADAANSIQDAINVCEAGDTVLVDNGTYFENLVINNVPIYLLGSSMDSTVIDGTGLSDSTVFFNNSNSTIENFKIYGSGLGIPSRAILLKGLPIIIRNCRISNVQTGIATVGSDASVSAYHVIFENIGRGFSLFNNSNNIISDCIIILHTSQAQGIHIGGPNPNSVYTITNNIIMLMGGGVGGQIGITSGAGTPGRVYIYNNLISGRFPANISLGNNIQDTAFIKNNVLLYQASNGPGSINAAASATIVNNVIMKNNSTGIFSFGRTQSDYNIFWGNSEDLDGLAYGDSDKVANPMFSKDTLPNPQLDFDYHLQAYSPAIDAGNPEILDVDGSRSDIGLYGGSLGQSYKYIDLPPRPPVNLSAVIDTNGIFLKWNRNSEADTSHYNVYRDTVTNFTIDSSKLVSSQTDTFFIQHAPYQSSQYVYKITCVDKQKNESLPSAEIVVRPTSVDEYPLVINDYILYQNYPNPFNPSTTIGYKLASRGYVKLMVYDITGSLVSVLENKEREAGYYEVEFDASDIRHQESGIRQLASGIYLYRIEIIGEGNIPVYSDMKKMILIK